ncbi:MAG: hypothetical protein WC404_04875 [Candidatus Omnitrophota bacterium]|jgi:hypothetical protein
MNCWEAVSKTFQGIPENEINDLLNTFRSKRGGWNTLEGSIFLRDCVEYLESQGYVFGCGAKDGCTPGCTC